MAPGKTPDEDEFEDSAVYDASNSRVVLDPQTDPRRPKAAVEISSAVTRSTLSEAGVVGSGMGPFEILRELERTLERARAEKFSHEGLLRSFLSAELMPALRHAVELAGGDGLDAFVARLVGVPDPRQRDFFLPELATGMQRLQAAQGTAAIFAEARAVIDRVRTALEQPSPKRLSVLWLRRELSRSVDLEMVLQVLCSTGPQLKVRQAQVGQAVENLGAQLRGVAGNPVGLFDTFARLKVEQRIVEAELARRPPR